MTLPRIAVIADAHFHSIQTEFGGSAAAHPPAFRRLAETARSPRLLNESAAALKYALDDILARGIRLVVLLGDYSDDGQGPTLAALHSVLQSYRRRGLRFYATVGNHDIFGASGRHRTKRFQVAGGYRVATSDPAFRDSSSMRVDLVPEIACLGYPEGLYALPEVGFFRGDSNLHWETPFGSDDAPAARMYSSGEGAPRLMDASYLVEPVAGLWLMMIDANAFAPLPSGELADTTDAGWDAMLSHKGFVLDWMADVAARASRHGKQLLTFSHYPVLGPLADTVQDERLLIGPRGLPERVPARDTSRRIMQTGIGLHFSGHLHVNETNRLRGEAGSFLVNVSLPSLVAWPAAYKIVTPAPGRVDVETVEIDAMPLCQRTQEAYRNEAIASGLSLDRMLDAPDYGAFTWEHWGHLVGRRFLKRDWPKAHADLLRRATLGDLVRLATGADPAPDATDADTARPALLFLEDWYRLRMGGELARDRIPPDRLAAYRRIAKMAAAARPMTGTPAQIARLFRMFEAYLDGLPARNFTIALKDGQITPLGATGPRRQNI